VALRRAVAAPQQPVRGRPRHDHRTVLAGILLIFPGVVSDLIALTLLLLPGPRVVADNAQRRERRGTFIEGDFRRTR